MKEFVIMRAGRRYRFRYVGRRRKVERSHATSEWLTAIGGRCPHCGSRWLRGDGDADIRYRTTRYPVWCERCGGRAVMVWATSPAMRDVYCAERAGMPVDRYRRWRDEVLAICEEDDPRGA